MDTPQIEKPTAIEQLLRWAAKLAGLLNAWWKLGTNRIQGFPVPTPSSSDDGKVLRFDSGTRGFIYASGGGSGEGAFVDADVPDGVIDGTTGSDGNPTFTLTDTPNPPESLLLMKTRAWMMPGVDFTLAGDTVTFLAPQIPTATPLDRLFAWYRI